MSTWHAIHPSPFDDACPDCAGYPAPEPEPTRAWSGRVAAACFLAIAVLVVLAGRLWA